MVQGVKSVCCECLTTWVGCLVGEKWFLKVVLWAPHTQYIHTQIKKEHLLSLDTKVVFLSSCSPRQQIKTLHTVVMWNSSHYRMANIYHQIVHNLEVPNKDMLLGLEYQRSSQMTDQKLSNQEASEKITSMESSLKYVWGHKEFSNQAQTSQHQILL